MELDDCNGGALTWANSRGITILKLLPLLSRFTLSIYPYHCPPS